MTQSIKVIYDTILAAAKRNELIVVEPEEGSADAAMLCEVSMDSLNITPLAVIYSAEPKKSEPAGFTDDDDKLLRSMGIEFIRSYPDMYRVAPD